MLRWQATAFLCILRRFAGISIGRLATSIQSELPGTYREDVLQNGPPEILARLMLSNLYRVAASMCQQV